MEAAGDVEERGQAGVASLVRSLRLPAMLRVVDLLLAVYLYPQSHG